MAIQTAVQESHRERNPRKQSGAAAKAATVTAAAAPAAATAAAAQQPDIQTAAAKQPGSQREHSESQSVDFPFVFIRKTWFRP